MSVLHRVRATIARSSPLTGRSARRAWMGRNRADIEVRGLHTASAEPFARRLEAALRQVEGVHWAEVNFVLGRVVVAFADGGVGLDDLVDVVSAVETADGMHEERLPTDRPDHPADTAPLHRQRASLAADLIGAGAGAIAPWLRGRVVPSYVSAGLALLDATPGLRRLLDARLGPATTDLLLVGGNAITQGLAVGPVGLLLDAVHRGSRLAEISARRAVWERRAPELHAHGAAADQPVEHPPRPGALPDGPIERYANRMALATLVGAAAVLAGARSHQRAQLVLSAGNPKAARLGREAFASWLGRGLAAGGVVPLDPAVLRRLDRLDTVVVDAAILAPGNGHGAPPARSGSRAASDTGQAGPDGVVPADGLDPHAEALVAAARSIGRLVIAGAGSGLGERLGADAVVPRGSRLAGAVRALQEQGATVALVAAENATALRAADCGIGLLGGPGAAPWSAHLVCGPGLDEAYRVLAAAAVARTASRVAAGIGLGGAVAAGVAALAGPSATAAARARLVVNAATAASLAAGGVTGWWSARRIPSPGETLTADRAASPGKAPTPDRTASPGEMLTVDRAASPDEIPTPDRAASPGETPAADRAPSAGRKRAPARTPPPGGAPSDGRSAVPGRKRSPSRTPSDDREPVVDRVEAG
ncbi:hypothetical protein [Dactylosporangium sp. NPDC048998]|uniref:hypothetical protein n=1 Tax=Dactylosporangium sp. NPDC048998 TaxID=3363976 RepID=UPI0037233A20